MPKAAPAACLRVSVLQYTELFTSGGNSVCSAILEWWYQYAQPFLSGGKSACGALQAVTTSIALELGMGSPLFAVSLAFSLIVMYDAAGVRRHAGDLH